MNWPFARNPYSISSRWMKNGNGYFFSFINSTGMQEYHHPVYSVLWICSFFTTFSRTVISKSWFVATMSPSFQQAPHSYCTFGRSSLNKVPPIVADVYSSFRIVNNVYVRSIASGEITASSSINNTCVILSSRKCSNIVLVNPPTPPRFLFSTILISESSIFSFSKVPPLSEMHTDKWPYACASSLLSRCSFSTFILRSTYFSRLNVQIPIPMLISRLTDTSSVS